MIENFVNKILEELKSQPALLLIAIIFGINSYLTYTSEQRYVDSLNAAADRCINLVTELTK